jgi:hypothetical protein
MKVGDGEKEENKNEINGEEKKSRQGYVNDDEAGK